MIWAIRLVPLLAVGALVWWVMGLRADNERLTVQNASLTAEAATQKRIIAVAEETVRVMRLRASALAEKAKKHDALREALIRGDFGNEILPAEFITFVCQLLPDTPNCSDSGSGDGDTGRTDRPDQD